MQTLPSAPRALVRLCSTTGLLALASCTLFPKEQTSTPPPSCPPEAASTMRQLGVGPGQRGTVTLDAQQPGGAEAYGVYRPGSLTSRLESDLGGLPAGTLLEGELRMENRKVQARYIQARPPNDQPPVPVCFMLGDAERGGIYPEAGSTLETFTLPRSVPVTAMGQGPAS